ncbi:hypothetical protein HUS23_09100 [Ectothiorhodospiraceae bacterium 2226]|nr:hypothetical protein HUS23_09100 [Ectothiorhodospiraceae bacterium 2226]
MPFHKKAWIGACAAGAFALSGLAHADGNRYERERNYHSEVSVSEAYVLTTYGRQNGADNAGTPNPVLLDVRSIGEYVAGHPDKALHVPYPRIHPTVDPTLSNEEKARLLVEGVKAAVPDLDTPLLVLCRTGARSIAAANILTEAGYTHVRNIWEGFEGMPKTGVNGNLLDLNNDGVIDERDWDGWKNFAGLPYSTKLRPTLIYQPLQHLYYE